MKHLLISFLAFISFVSCDDKNKYDINADNNYTQSKITIEKTERNNPVHFLSASAKRRKNFIRQTVVTGNIYNNAKVVTYKDAEILLSFYSKTGTLLEEDRQTVYEHIVPGGTVSFKSKYFTPQGTDSMSVKVVSAKF